MHLFHEAQQQLAAAMSEAGSGARVVQLGDLGGYKYKPGGWMLGVGRAAVV
jgi:hypothetical protein